MIAWNDGYNKKVPPFEKASLLGTSTIPVHVDVLLRLLNIMSINEADNSIDLQFEIILEWKDYRLTYRNLKDQPYLNTLTDDDIDKVWLPLVIYDNTDQKETTRLGETWEWKTWVVVRREEEKGTMSGLESVDETEIFKGSENSLVMNQTYTHAFQCNYELSYYPFDTQVDR